MKTPNFINVVKNKRHNKNYIPYFFDNDCVVEGLEEIGKVFASYFHSQFNSNHTFRFQFSWPRLLSSEQRINLTPLEDPFIVEEVKKITFELRTNKALGPNNFPIFFGFSHTL